MKVITDDQIVALREAVNVASALLEEAMVLTARLEQSRADWHVAADMLATDLHRLAPAGSLERNDAVAFYVKLSADG